MENLTCCFIGHRNAEDTSELRIKLNVIIENLITQNKVGNFLFGSRSRFNDISYEAVSGAKEKYPHIKRIFVRAEYPIINDNYKEYLLKSYEDTYFPQKLIKAGKAVYVERNYEMINKSDFCVFYFFGDKNIKEYKSGTKMALDYAKRQRKRIILINE